DHHRNEHEPRIFFGPFPHPGDQIRIVQFVTLEKGHVGAYLLALLPKDPFHLEVLVDLDRILFLDRHHGVEIQGDAHDQAETDLPHNLELSLETLFVLFEDLDIVIHSPDFPYPEQGDHQQVHIDVLQVCIEQYGQYGREDDDDAPHGGGARLLLLS